MAVVNMMYLRGFIKTLMRLAMVFTYMCWHISAWRGRNGE